MDLIILAATFFGIPAILYFAYDLYLKRADKKHAYKRWYTGVFPKTRSTEGREDHCIEDAAVGCLLTLLAVLFWGGVVLLVWWLI